MSAIYEGYHREWQPDPSWRYGSYYRKSRQPHCDNLPVADLQRYSFRTHRYSWWAYCADHLYGRKIENGQVLHNILVKDDDE